MKKMKIGYRFMMRYRYQVSKNKVDGNELNIVEKDLRFKIKDVMIYLV